MTEDRDWNNTDNKEIEAMQLLLDRGYKVTAPSSTRYGIILFNKKTMRTTCMDSLTLEGIIRYGKGSSIDKDYEIIRYIRYVIDDGKLTFYDTVSKEGAKGWESKCTY